MHRDTKTGKLVPDNCVECLTHDMAVARFVVNGKVGAFQVYVGGGQGERNGKPATATLGKPLTVVPENQLMKVLTVLWLSTKNTGTGRIVSGRA